MMDVAERHLHEVIKRVVGTQWVIGSWQKRYLWPIFASDCHQRGSGHHPRGVAGNQLLKRGSSMLYT